MKNNKKELLKRALSALTAISMAGTSLTGCKKVELENDIKTVMSESADLTQVDEVLSKKTIVVDGKELSLYDALLILEQKIKLLDKFEERDFKFDESNINSENEEIYGELVDALSYEVISKLIELYDRDWGNDAVAKEQRILADMAYSRLNNWVNENAAYIEIECGKACIKTKSIEGYEDVVNLDNATIPVEQTGDFIDFYVNYKSDGSNLPIQIKVKGDLRDLLQMVYNLQGGYELNLNTYKEFINKFNEVLPQSYENKHIR